LKKAAIIKTTIMILNTFGVPFFFNHLIKGRNKSAMNMAAINGMKIKDSVFNKKKTKGTTIMSSSILVVLRSFIYRGFNKC